VTFGSITSCSASVNVTPLSVSPHASVCFEICDRCSAARAAGAATPVATAAGTTFRNVTSQRAGRRDRDSRESEALTAYDSSSSSVLSCGLLVATSSISGSGSSTASTSSSVNDRPVVFIGIGPRGRSASFFFDF